MLETNLNYFKTPYHIRTWVSKSMQMYTYERVDSYVHTSAYIRLCLIVYRIKKTALKKKLADRDR